MNILNTLKGIFGFNKKQGIENSVEQLIEDGILEESFVEDLSDSSKTEEVKVERTLIEVVSSKIERQPGYNKLFHSDIVKLSDGDVINPRSVSGDTAIEVGYHPCGYSLWNEEVVELEDGTFSVTWNSFNTCD